MKTIIFTLVTLIAAGLTSASFAFAGPHAGGGHVGASSHAGKSPGASKPHALSPNNRVVNNAIKPITPTNKKATPNSIGKGQRSNKSYFSANAQKFAHGYYYHGRRHNHWSEFRFDARYGCQLYYDDGLHGWFYYCCQDDCYYPVNRNQKASQKRNEKWTTGMVAG